MNAAKLLAQYVLEHHENYEWSLQGFGMLRTYLQPEVRLHVWDSRYAVSNVSIPHTHPWNFHSEVIAGELNDVIYTEDDDNVGYLFNKELIVCGENAEAGSEYEEVFLLPKFFAYNEGERYRTDMATIHETSALDGTITLISRDSRTEHDHAYSYWRRGGDWVSAAPRKATKKEIKSITRNALKEWF